MRRPTLLLALLGLAPAAFGDEKPAATAEKPTETDLDARAYCDAVEGAADAESALLVAPEAFVSFGAVKGVEDVMGSNTLKPSPRLQAGLSWSTSGFVRGLHVKSRARAECERYRTLAGLRTALESESDDRSAAALAAKLKVLEDALPRAAELVANRRAAMKEARVTVREVQALELRVDQLQELAAQTRAQLESIPPPKPNQPRTVAALAERRGEVEADVERLDAKIRSTRGWDLTLRGGYDRFLNRDEDLPVFAMATLTVNLGWPFMGGGNSRAVSGRREWARRQLGGVSDYAQTHAQGLRALLKAEKVRLEQTAALLEVLEERKKEIDSLPGDKAQEFANQLWLDWVNVKADHAYLTKNVEELGKLVGEGGDSTL